MGRRGAKLSKEDEEKVRASFLLTKNIRKTARELGYSSATVHAIVHRPQTQRALLEQIQTVAELETRRRSWVSVGATVLEKESVHKMLQFELRKEDPDPLIARAWASILKDLDISYGIDVEKARLLNEQATAITARAEEIRGQMPAGVTEEILIRVVRQSIGSETVIHQGLMEQGVASG